MEEEIIDSLPESWDYVDKNIVYSHAVPSDSIPPGIIMADEDNCIGEKDVFLYDKETKTVGYLEIKSSKSHSSKRNAKNQLRRAQNHWNSLGYDFAGGFIVEEDAINTWNGEEIDFKGLKPSEYTPGNASRIEANPKSTENINKGRLALKLEDLGWDEAFENIIYGDVLNTDLSIKNQGLIQTNEHNTHFGQMDAVAHRDYEQGQIIGHIERLDYNERLKESIEASAGRIDFSHDFWTNRGYDFQAALYHEGELFRRNPETQEWIDKPTE